MGKFGLILGVAISLTSLSFGQTKKKPAPPLTCPVCHMALATKKSAANPVKVVKNGKTYYCCAKCDMKPAKKKAKV